MVKLKNLLKEIAKFDVKKTLALIKTDKFLLYVVKKDFRGKVDANTLEQIYFMYIKGDKNLEKQYNKV